MVLRFEASYFETFFSKYLFSRKGFSFHGENTFQSVLEIKPVSETMDLRQLFSEERERSFSGFSSPGGPPFSTSCRNGRPPSLNLSAQKRSR